MCPKLSCFDTIHAVFHGTAVLPVNLNQSQILLKYRCHQGQAIVVKFKGVSFSPSSNQGISGSNHSFAYTHLQWGHWKQHVLTILHYFYIVILRYEWPLKNYNCKHFFKDVSTCIFLISVRERQVQCNIIYGLVLSLPLIDCIHIQKFLNKLWLTQWTHI